jgi:hypothetical protein
MRAGRLHITRLPHEIKLLIEIGDYAVTMQAHTTLRQPLLAWRYCPFCLFISFGEIGGGKLFDRPCIIANADVRAFVFDDTAEPLDCQGWDLDAGNAWGKGV